MLLSVNWPSYTQQPAGEPAVAIIKEPSCNDPSDPQLLPVEEARRRMQSQLRAITATEAVLIEDALGRVLSSDVAATFNVPTHTNSAMDGYALCASSIPAKGSSKLDVIGTAWAGKAFAGSVITGQAVRIFTGAILPEGADTVVIQEHVEAVGSTVNIDSEVEAGRNIRQAGEDVQQGQTVLAAGERVGPAELGLLASLGIADVDMFRRLRVAFFTTGDELRALHEHAGTELAPGLLFDSNRYTLLGMLTRLGVEIIDMGIVRDSADATKHAFKEASEQADIVITSGGVSAGDADFVTSVFHEMGNVSFWKLAMRPGRPLAFGHIGEAAFFGLPGNPVAVMVTFLQFVQPSIKQMMGMRNTSSVSVKAVSLSQLKKSPGRVEYQRGVLGRNDDDELTVRSTGKQGAGRLSSMCLADCLIVLHPGSGHIDVGDKVEVQPFHGLL